MTGFRPGIAPCSAECCGNVPVAAWTAAGRRNRQLSVKQPVVDELRQKTAVPSSCNGRQLSESPIGTRVIAEGGDRGWTMSMK